MGFLRISTIVSRLVCLNVGFDRLILSLMYIACLLVFGFWLSLGSFKCFSPFQRVLKWHLRLEVSSYSVATSCLIPISSSTDIQLRITLLHLSAFIWTLSTFSSVFCKSCNCQATTISWKEWLRMHWYLDLVVRRLLRQRISADFLLRNKCCS